MEFRRWEAIFSLRKVAVSSDVERLVHHLDPAHEQAVRVRNETALCIGQIGGAEAVEPLLRALVQDPSHQVRWRAAMALSRVREPLALSGLEAALQSETHEEVRKHIIKTIEKLR